MLNRFDDRTAAGRALATLLAGYGGRNDVVVLGLPRGGMLPAFEVAGALNGPLDVLVTRKLGAPGAPEFALGAIASGEVTVINESAMHLFLNSQELNSVIAQAQAEPGDVLPWRSASDPCRRQDGHPRGRRRSDRRDHARCNPRRPRSPACAHRSGASSGLPCSLRALARRGRRARMRDQARIPSIRRRVLPSLP